MSEKKKDAWTIMIYMAGDNNLTDECVYSLMEMKKVDLGQSVNVIAQFDPRDDYLPTHRYRITHNQAHGSLIKDRSDTAPFENESLRAKRNASIREKAKEAAQEAAARIAAEEASKELSKSVRRGAPPPTIILPVADDDVRTDETDTGSPVTLYNFMSACINQFPAEHYMVVLNGHGAGTGRDFLLKDDSPTGSLTMNELKLAFEELQPELNDQGKQAIDILGMDVCLMSMAEICFELKGLAEIIVGCESYSPASGWPYFNILDRLRKDFSKPAQKDAPSQFAKAIVEEYVSFYSDYWLGGLSVDQSALDMRRADDLRQQINLVGDALADKLEKKDAQEAEAFKRALILAHWEAQSYNGELFVDFADFCDCVIKYCDDENIRMLCAQAASFVRNEFVLKSCYSGPMYQYSNGVSIYFPWSKVEDNYSNLDFVKASEGRGWARFIKSATELTRREVRTVKTEAADNLFEINRTTPPQFRISSGKGPDVPMHSMRNPPIVWDPRVCLDEGESIVPEIERLFLS
jgi:hypothetical protein